MGARYRFTHALAHEVVYQNLLLARRTELHQTTGRVLERIAGPHPERLSDLEALGHHWSLSADKPRGARYLLAAGDWARAVYANDDAIRHYERALRTLAECELCEVETRAARERLARSAGPHRAAGRGARALRIGAAGARGLRGSRGRRAPRIGRSAACTGRPVTASAPAPASPRASNAWAMTATRSSARTCSRRWAGSRSAAGDNAGAIEWAERALAEMANEKETATDARRALARPRPCARRPTTPSASRSRRTGRLTEAVAQIEQSIGLAEARDLLQDACRGYTNLGVLYSSLDPRRSIETCLEGSRPPRRSAISAFSHGSTRISRWPTAP